MNRQAWRHTMRIAMQGWMVMTLVFGSALLSAQEPSAEAKQIVDLKAEIQILRDTLKTSEADHGQQLKSLIGQLESVRAQIPVKSADAKAKDARTALKAECEAFGTTFRGDLQIPLGPPATTTRPATPRTVVILCQ